MFQKKILAVLFVLAFVFGAAAYAGKVELTTYYPAPFGEYAELKAQKSTVTGTGITNDTVAFQASGSNPAGALVVTNANNVGIGTNIPATKLEVQGGPIKATGGLIIETRGTDPANPENGRMWLRI